jgi:hypothetical protein
MPKTNRQELKEVLEELTIYYIQGLRAHAQDTVLRKTRIDVLYAKQSYEPFSWKSCLRPPSGICEYPHEPARGIRAGT